jgi:hypothetical protein
MIEQQLIGFVCEHMILIERLSKISISHTTPNFDTVISFD